VGIRIDNICDSDVSMHEGVDKKIGGNLQWKINQPRFIATYTNTLLSANLNETWWSSLRYIWKSSHFICK
jgi:hypothetical protein